MGASASKPSVKPRDAARVKAAAEHLESSVRDQLLALDKTIQGSVLLAPEIDSDSESAEAYHRQRERPYFFNDANYPSAIILCGSAEDVAAAVKVVMGLDRGTCKLAVASGCHSAYCMVEQAIVLDLEKMNHVQVDTDQKLLTLGGGTKIEVANKALEGTGLGFMTGTNGDTGVSGLTLAGGAGYLGGQAGYACDTVVQAKVVLPDGTIVTATDTNDHADLLRALRGGGGNFGVVVEWAFRLFDVRQCFGGMVVHLAPTVARLTTVLENYAKLLLDLPDQGATLCAMPAGAPVFVTLYTMIGDGAQLENAKTFKDVPFLVKGANLGAWARLSNDLGRKDYHKDICPMLEPVQQRGNGTATGAMVYDFGPEIRQALIHFTRVDLPKAKHVKPLIIVQCLWGKMRRDDGSNSSLRHRKAVAWIIIEAAYEPNATDDEIKAVRDWATRAKRRILELGGEDGPHNFCDTDGRRIKFFTDEQRAFLETAKLKYDPTNLFALNKNVAASHTE